MSTNNLCFEQKYEKYQFFLFFFFLSENFQFLEVKFSTYLNRRDFVMKKFKSCEILQFHLEWRPLLTPVLTIYYGRTWWYK